MFQLLSRSHIKLLLTPAVITDQDTHKWEFAPFTNTFFLHSFGLGLHVVHFYYHPDDAAHIIEKMIHAIMPKFTATVQALAIDLQLTNADAPAWKNLINKVDWNSIASECNQQQLLLFYFCLVYHFKQYPMYTTDDRHVPTFD